MPGVVPASMCFFWGGWLQPYCGFPCFAGKIGFFINTALTMLTVHASLWVLLLLAFGELTGRGQHQKWLWSVQVLQLGSLSVVVYWVTLVLGGRVVQQCVDHSAPRSCQVRDRRGLHSTAD